MSRLGKTAAESAKGSLITFMGSSLSLLLSAVGGIIVARLLSPSEYGLFAVALVPASFFSMFSDWGVNSAITRFTARYGSVGEKRRLRDMIWTALIFKLALGAVLSCALYLSADWVAEVLIKRPEAGDLVRVVSLAIISQSLYNTTLSTLAGLEAMDRRAIVTLSQAAIKALFSPLLVYIGLGVSGAVTGYVLSYATAASIGFLLTLLSTPKPVTHSSEELRLRDNLWTMMGFGLPLFMGGLAGSLVTQIRNLLLPWFVSDELIGNYNVASRFTSLIALITGSLGITLYPTFSKYDYDTDPDKAREVFRKSVRYSTMIVLPATTMLAALAEPAVHTILPEYPRAPPLLALLLAPTLLVGAGSLSIGRFLNSQGDTRTSLKIALTGSITSLLLSPILLWKLSVEGFITSTLISALVSNLLGLRLLYKKYGLTSDTRHTGKTLLSSAVSAASTHLILHLLSQTPPVLRLITGSGIYTAVYLILAPLTSAIEKRDIDNLKGITKEFTLISTPARMLLNIESRIIKYASG